MTPSPDADPSGTRIVRAALPAASCTRWRQRADERHARRTPGDPAYEPVSASFRLHDVPGLDAADIFDTLCQGPAGRHVQALLPGPRLLALDLCWLRRQAAPRHAVAPQRPHAWHQDGACGHDFLAAAPTPVPPLPMLVCWLPLVDCGRDAPGLQWLARPLQHLLQPAELADDVVARRFAAAELRAPELAAGDALLFDGRLLHRTHASTSMHAERCSIELRLFPGREPPARLAGGRFVAV